MFDLEINIGGKINMGFFNRKMRIYGSGYYDGAYNQYFDK